MIPRIGPLALPLIMAAASVQAGELPRAYRSASMLGSGGAGISAVADSEALLHNPANLGFMADGLAEISVLNLQLMYSQEVLDLAKEPKKLSDLQKKPIDLARYLEGKDVHAGFQNFTGASFSRHSLGVIMDGHLNATLITNPVTFYPDMAGVIDSYAGVLYGYGHKLEVKGQTLSIGANAKFLQKDQQVIALAGAELVEKTSRSEKVKMDDLVTKHKGSGFGTDLAVSWQAPELPIEQRASLVVRNLGGVGYSGGKSAPSQDRQTINIGSASSKTFADVHQVQVLADIEDLFNAYGHSFYKRLHLGATYSFAGLASASVGINQGYLTYGLRVGYRFASFEYAQFTEELGSYPGQKPNKRTAMKFKLGWWL